MAHTLFNMELQVVALELFQILVSNLRRMKRQNVVSFTVIEEYWRLFLHLEDSLLFLFGHQEMDHVLRVKTLHSVEADDTSESLWTTVSKESCQ